MNDATVIAALRAKRADLEGELRQAEQRAARLRDDILTIDGALRIFDPTATARAPRQPKVAGSIGQFSRAVLDVLRRAEAPMTCRQIATQVAAERGMEAGTTAARMLLTNRVRPFSRASATGWWASRAGMRSSGGWSSGGRRPEREGGEAGVG